MGLFVMFTADYSIKDESLQRDMSAAEL